MSILTVLKKLDLLTVDSGPPLFGFAIEIFSLPSTFILSSFSYNSLTLRFLLYIVITTFLFFLPSFLFFPSLLSVISFPPFSSSFFLLIVFPLSYSYIHVMLHSFTSKRAKFYPTDAFDLNSPCYWRLLVLQPARSRVPVSCSISNHHQQNHSVQVTYFPIHVQTVPGPNVLLHRHPVVPASRSG